MSIQEAINALPQIIEFLEKGIPDILERLATLETAIQKVRRVPELDDREEHASPRPIPTEGETSA